MPLFHSRESLPSSRLSDWFEGPVSWTLALPVKTEAKKTLCTTSFAHLWCNRRALIQALSLEAFSSQGELNLWKAVKPFSKAWRNLCRTTQAVSILRKLTNRVLFCYTTFSCTIFSHSLLRSFQLLCPDFSVEYLLPVSLTWPSSESPNLQDIVSE